MSPPPMLLFLSSFLLSACTQVPDCHVQSEYVETAMANAGCLVRHNRQMLVVKQRASGRYSIPAGTNKANESAQCTAHRETWEETGINVQVGQLLQVFDNGFRLYHCQVVERNIDTTSEPEIPIQGRMEVSSAFWTHPANMTKESWRYPQQLPVIQQLFNELAESP